MIKPLIRDLKFGLQLLLRNKTFSAVALLTLALCIGANSAIFSVINGVLITPLGYPEPDRLVEFFNSYPKVGVGKTLNGAPDYLDRRQASEVLESAALVRSRNANISFEGSSMRVRGMLVTPDYFSVFQVPPAIGRAFTEEEGLEGNDAVAILEHSLWQQLFGGRQDAIGRKILVNDRLHEVIGVMPDGYEMLPRDAMIILPFALTQELIEARHNNYARMYGRMRPGVTLQQLQSRIDALNRENYDRFPQYRDRYDKWGFNSIVVGLHDQMVAGIRSDLYLLQAGVFVILLIGCVNLANLMLVRSNQRQGEIALRFALGAGRTGVARQLLTEGLLLALAGGALGLAVGKASLQTIVALGAEQLPRSAEIALDGNVLLFTLAISLLTGILFSAIPVLQSFRRDLQTVFRQTSRTGSGGRLASWVRSGLVTAQVAMAFVLLICAGLLLSSFQKLQQVDPGFDSQGLFTARVSLRGDRYREAAQRRAFVDEALERVGALPGVQEAAVASRLPLEGINYSDVVTVEGNPLGEGEKPPMAVYSFIGANYFEIMKIPLIRGRSFDDRDSEGGQCAAVIDQGLSDKFWKDANPLGGQIRRGQKGPFCTVVGVAAAVKMKHIAETQPIGAIYFFYRQFRLPEVVLVIRMQGPMAPLAASVRKQISQIDPGLPLYDAATMQGRISESLQRRRTPMMLLTVFAAVAVALSAIGIYGVLAFSVGQRVKEFGIKLALGAQPSSILKQVLGRGLALILIGLGLGLGAALAVSRLLEGMLYGIAPVDPQVYLLVALLLTVAALTACLIPSLRATRVDAVEVLRFE